MTHHFPLSETNTYTKNTSYYLNKVDGEVDGLLASTDVVGNYIRHKGVF